MSRRQGDILTEAWLATITKARVSGGVVGTRHKVRQKLDPLKRATDAKSNIPTQSGLCVKALGVTAGSNPAHSPPKYRSKWEASFASKLDLEQKAGIVRRWWYEPFSVWLPGKIRYKPDFLVEYEPMAKAAVMSTDFRLEIVEVKGFSKNQRDGITRLKVAAALFPCFVWRMAWRTKQGGWDGKYITA